MYLTKNLLKLGSLIVGIMICSLVFAQSSYYYYGGGIQRPLLLSEEKVTVRFSSSLTPAGIQDFILSESALDPNKEPEPTREEFMVLYVLPGNDIEALIQRLRVREEVEMANPVYLSSDSLEMIVTDMFVAQFYPEISLSYIDSLNAQHGAVVIDSNPDVPNLFLLKLTGDIDKDALVSANQYYEDTTTEYSHAEFLANILSYSYIPDDSFFQYQWNYENTGQIGGKVDADIDASLAWEICKGDPDLKIAVLDTGGEPHEDLGPLAQGYDVIGNYPDYEPDWDPTPGQEDSWCAHGEACAGLISALQDNQMGISGLAPLCQIVPIKIFSDENCKSSSVYPWEIAEAFDMAHALGARIASNSWGYGRCDVYYEEIAQAINRFVRPKPPLDPEGGVVVFATGNGYKDCVDFPAYLDSVIAVGASDSIDGVWSYSNGGTALDLVAPSGLTGTLNQLRGDIWTTDLTGEKGFNPSLTGPLDANGNQNYTGKFGGTSAACPQVAAAAALIKVQWSRLYPVFPCSSYQVKQIIENSAEIIKKIGPQEYIKRLNAFRALLAISRGDANNDKSISVTDVNYLLNFLFHGGPPPVPVLEMGDANCDGDVSISDVVYLISYLFKGGAKPPICYNYPNNY
jgi:subtilisin family serine protease